MTRGAAARRVTTQARAESKAAPTRHMGAAACPSRLHGGHLCRRIAAVTGPSVPHRRDRDCPRTRAVDVLPCGGGGRAALCRGQRQMGGVRYVGQPSAHCGMCTKGARAHCCARATRVGCATRERAGAAPPHPRGRRAKRASGAGVCTREARAATAAAAPHPARTRPRVGGETRGHHHRRGRTGEPRAYVSPSDAPQVRPHRPATGGGGPGTLGSNRRSPRWPGRLARRPVAHRGTNGQHGKITRKTKKRHARVCAISRALVGHRFPEPGALALSHPRCTPPSEGPGLGGCGRRGTASSPCENAATRSDGACGGVRGEGGNEQLRPPAGQPT